LLTSTVLVTMLDYLLKLKVGSIKIYPSVTFNELKKFFSLFTYSTHLVGTREEVKNLLTLCKSKNIRIIQAEYVKVSEKETVVSRKDYTFKLKTQGEPLRIDEIKKLITYLKEGALHFKKKELRKFDQIIRDPQNISTVLFYSAAKIQELKLLQNVGSWEDLIITYLWLVSEYLTRKIQAGKPLDKEVAFLEDFKRTLDARIEKNSLPIKEEGRQKIEKTYTEIKNKLTIEGLLVQFIKEKGKLEEIETRLLRAINSIDSQSLLYRAILRKIRAVGLPAEKIFRLVGQKLPQGGQDSLHASYSSANTWASKT